MTDYYFDLETTGLDPEVDEIITAQLQRLDLRGNAAEPLTVLKGWEIQEAGILSWVIPFLTRQNPFEVVPVGNNLLFDFGFLARRAAVHGLTFYDLWGLKDRPFIDLKHALVLVNEGMFKGYHRVLRAEEKPDVPALYREGKYDEIVRYVELEAAEFLRAYGVLRLLMPPMRILIELSRAV